ncbi:hypothetical protein [Streptomyces mirabilis]|uniref:hypothetical protein n=1 Tax=Streptomyces mirabilis TaxID=68239 RepID=UPI0036991A20
MSTLDFLSRLVGSQVLGDHFTAAVNDLVAREHLAPRDAYQWVVDQADEGDPGVLASTGQTWVRRGDVDPEEAPAKRLFIVERMETGVFVLYRDLDTAADATDDGDLSHLNPPDRFLNDASRGAELPIGLLDLYELESWEAPEFLLPTVVRPKGASTP